jgi:hypothetical protein
VAHIITSDEITQSLEVALMAQETGLTGAAEAEKVPTRSQVVATEVA